MKCTVLATPRSRDSSDRCIALRLRTLRERRALTLIELLLTIAVLGILAAILVPQLGGDVPERLSAGAQIVAADVDYARSLAVSNNSTYCLTFDPSSNSYYLQHTGGNAQFNTLPRSPFRQSDDPVDRQTTKLAMLPLPEPGVRLVAVAQMQGAGVSTASLQFTPLGGTTSTYSTVIWLACGGGTLQRYVSIAVDPVTGLITIGSVVSSLPTAVNSMVQGGT
jgi:prepilin-type N-terminal cleavage/methylation domain-containing protein